MLRSTDDLLNFVFPPMSSTDDLKELNPFGGHGGKTIEQRKTRPLGITLQRLQEITGGEIVKGSPSSIIGTIATDSRNVEKGDTFLALKGTRFDGHRFIEHAVEKGASTIIMEARPREYPNKNWKNCLCVEDTTEALLKIAKWRRKTLGFKTICITGSCGKTSTKDMVTRILSKAFRVSATFKNFNNLVGVPLTLLNTEPGIHWAVLELGMSTPGEIKRLSQVALPDIAALTNVAPAHLEGLGDLEGIAREKIELFTTLSQEKIACVNLDDPMITKYSKDIPCTKIGYTMEKNFASWVQGLVRLISWRPNGTGMSLRLDADGTNMEIFSPLAGFGNLQNIICAVSICVASGIKTSIIKEAFSQIRAPASRLNFLEINTRTIIDDTYNANPWSTKNALATMAFWSNSGERVAILGDMLELGEKAPLHHHEIGRYCGHTGVNKVLAVGRYCEFISKGAMEAGIPQSKIFQFGDRDDLVRYLAKEGEDIIPKGAWVLVKGSRAMKMEKVIDVFKRI